MMALGTERVLHSKATAILRRHARAVPLASTAAARRDSVPRPDVVAQRVLACGAAAMMAVLLVVWMTGVAREPGMNECRVTPGSLAFASQVNATIRMRGPITCAIPLASDTASDVQLRIPPEYGSVTLADGRVSYRPAPRFKGKDFFIVAVRDRTARLDATSIARVHVFVK